MFASFCCLSVLACSAVLTAPEDGTNPPASTPEGGPGAETGPSVDGGVDGPPGLDACAGECERKFADVTQLAANDTHVFVAYRDGIARCTQATCERKLYAPAAGADARAIALDASGRLFFTFRGTLYGCGGSPFDCEVERSNIQELATFPAAELVILSTTFVWTSASSSLLYQNDRTQNLTKAPIAMDRTAAPLVLRGDTAIFANVNGIYQVNTAGGLEPIKASYPGAADIAVSPTKLLVINAARTHVTLFDLASANMETSIPAEGATALAMTSTTAFWTRRLGEVVKLETNGTTATTFVSNVVAPRLIAASGKNVWFTTNANADGKGLSTLEHRPF